MKLSIKTSLSTSPGGRSAYRFSVTTDTFHPIGLSKRYNERDSAEKGLRALIKHIDRVKFIEAPGGSSFEVRSSNGAVVFKSNTMDSGTRDALYKTLKDYSDSDLPKTYTYKTRDYEL